MSRKTEFAKNTAILTVGKICTQFINFFLLPLYTVSLSTEEYGTYDLLITYGTLFLPLVNWQLDQGLFRFVLDQRGNKVNLSNIFSTLSISSMMQSIVYAILYLLIAPRLHMENTYFLLFYVILQIFVALLLQFVRGLGKSANYALASFISATITIIFSILTLVVFKMGVEGLYLSCLIAQVITIIYLLFSSRAWEYFSVKKYNISLLKEIMRYSLPLIPNNLSWWVINASDRTIISYFIGTAANGIYSVASRFSHAFISFYNILNLSWTETVSLHFNDEDRDEFLTETMTALYKMFASACFLIIAIMPFIFNILINVKFKSAYNHILILMYAMLFRVVVGLYSCVYIAEKKAGKIATTTFAAAIINIVVNLLLINKIGIYAASFSTLIAFSSMAIIRYIDVNRTIHMKIKKSVFLSSLVVALILVYIYYCDNKWYQFIGLIATIIYAGIINIDMIRAAIRILNNFAISIR